ncbi:amino acid adenylation domain-containing protein [Paenibacillus kyungheensis]
MEKQYRPEYDDICQWFISAITDLHEDGLFKMDVNMTFSYMGLDSQALLTLSGSFGKWIGQNIEPTLFWELPSIDAVARHFAGLNIQESVEQSPMIDKDQAGIAIIGMGCHFPQSPNIETFWTHLQQGDDCISEIDGQRSPLFAEAGIHYAGLIDAIDLFDHEAFRISPREAEEMDPQQRILLEVTGDALEDAGLTYEQLQGSRTGVFIGISSNDYGYNKVSNTEHSSIYSVTGNAHSIAANRISYVWDLRGPSMAIDTACSSSLVAVHLACQSLQTDESNIAIAGGVNLILNPAISQAFQQAGMLAEDGRCKTFASSANGYVRGEGAGTVILKKLSTAIRDQDRIYGVIRGSAVNQDGMSNGLTAPNAQAQEEVLTEAYRRAGISAHQIQYIEAHGTGTPLGDPIEANTLGKILAADREAGDICAIGSVKTNIGHLEAAAGIAGLIKTTLCIYHQKLVPHLHFSEESPYIPFANLPIRVLQETEHISLSSDQNIYAGISAFGFGGTNAHVVLQNYQHSIVADSTEGYNLLPLSARSAQGLHQRVIEMKNWLVDHPYSLLTDIAYTTQQRRNHYPYRVAVIGQNREEWIQQLESKIVQHSTSHSLAKILFVFSGQGTQWVGMGREFIESYPVFKKAFIECDTHWSHLSDWSLWKELYTEYPQHWEQRTDIAQPLVIAIQLSLVALWKSFGVEPAAVVGHSLGEIAACYTAGIINLQEALQIVHWRSNLMQTAQGKGAMLSIATSLETVQQLLNNAHWTSLSIAAINSYHSVVVAGKYNELEELRVSLSKDTQNKYISTQFAFHSSQMIPLAEQLIPAIQSIKSKLARHRWYSTVTGKKENGLKLSLEHWQNNMTQPVLFAKAIEQAKQDGYHTVIEIGPHSTLLPHIEQQYAEEYDRLLLPSMQRNEEKLTFLKSLMYWYERGGDVLWNQQVGHCISLPTYPWDRQRFWIDDPTSNYLQPWIQPTTTLESIVTAQHPIEQMISSVEQSDIAQPLFENYLIDHICTILKIKEPQQLPTHQPLVMLGMDSIMAMQLRSQLESHFGITLSLVRFLEGMTVEQAAQDMIELLVQKKNTAIPLLSTDDIQIKTNQTSYGEKALWLLHMLQPQSCAYHVQGAWDIVGEINEQRLQYAANSLCYAHESLRTVYHHVNGEIERDLITEPVADLRTFYIQKWDTDAVALLNSHLQEAYRLDKGPLFQIRLYITDDHRTRMMISLHHIITDAWSAVLLLEELFAQYTHATSKPDIPYLPATSAVPYSAFVHWQEQYMNSIQAEKDKQYWIKELQLPLPVLNIPVHSNITLSDTPNAAAACPFRLNKSLSTQVVLASRAAEVTVSTFLISAFAALLHHFSKQPEIVIGTFVTGRSESQFEKTLGYFVNTVALKIKIPEFFTNHSLLTTVKTKMLSAMQHQNYPFPLVVDQLNQQHQGFNQSVFQAAFVMERAQGSYNQQPVFTGNTDDLLQFGEITLSPVELPTLATPFELTLMMEESNSLISGKFLYQTDKYDESFIQQMIQQLILGIEQLTASTMDETKKELQDVQQEKESFIGLHHLLHYQALHRPDHIAVNYLQQSITYLELDRKSTEIAILLQSQGIDKQHFIGVSLERSIDMLIAIFGIVKAGAAYVPIDPAYPLARKRYMAEFMHLSILFTHSGLQSEFAEDVPRFDIDCYEFVANTQALTEYKDEVHINDLAYVIFTSGSTGQPKAVMIEHQGIWNMAQEQRKYFHLDEDSHVMQFASFSFDAWIFEVTMAFRNGASLHIVPPMMMLPGPATIQWMNEQQITHAVLPPSVLTLLPADPLSYLQVIISAGEACSHELVQRWGENRKFFNAYGPSEATVWSMIKECSISDPVIDLGEAIANVNIHVLDEQKVPVQINSVGELYIEAIGLARGYYNDHIRSEERFGMYKDYSVSAISKQKRMYQTGDLVKVLPDQRLLFVGRKDYQVKIRGLLVNLGEVESAISLYKGVTNNVVLTIPEPQSNQLQLIAFVTLARPIQEAEKQIKTYLQSRLPSAFIPTRIIEMDVFPLTPNGKIDRKLLLENSLVDHIHPSYERVNTFSFTEELLIEIWQGLLNRSDIQLTDSFLQVGGHSLMAVQLCSRIQLAFQVDYPIQDVFEQPVLQDMAKNINHLLDSVHHEPSDATMLTTVLGESPYHFPLTSTQQKIWLLQAVDERQNAYLIPGALSVQGTLDPFILSQSIQTLIDRHDALRMQVVIKEGKPFAHIELLPPFQLIQYSSTEQEIMDHIRYECRQPFALTGQPLFRFTLWTTEEKQYLTLVVHHLIMDGWSMSLLLGELGQVYESILHENIAELPLLPANYADYAIWEHQWRSTEMYQKQLDYWMATFKDGIASVELPTDYVREPQLSYPGDIATLQLPLDLSRQLMELSRSQGCTLFMTMMTVFDILLYRLSGQSDIVVGVPVAGRNQRPFESVVGLFVNTLLLRTEVNSELAFVDLLHQVRDTAVKAYTHQDLPLDHWLEALNVQRNTGLSSLFRVMFNMLNIPPVHLHIDHIEADIMELKEHTSKFELTLYAQENQYGILLEAVYASNLFTKERMQEFLVQFEQLCRQIVADTSQTIDQYSLLSHRISTIIPDLSQPLVIPDTKTIRSIPVRFAEQVECHSQHAAIIDDKGQIISYQQLQQASYRYTGQIVDSIKDSMSSSKPVIAILGTRSAELVVAILSVIHTDAIFTILDARYPIARLTTMMRLANVQGLILAGDQQLLAESATVLAQQAQWMLEINLENVDQSDDIHPAVSNFHTMDLNQPAYILFTSGTSGEPKAIICSHEPLTVFINGYKEIFDIGAADRFSMFSGISHDPLLRDILVPLCHGATICIPNETQMRFPAAMYKWMEQQEITCTHLTPAMAAILTGYSKRSTQPLPLVHWRYAIFSGDTLLQSQVNAIYTIAPYIQCFNGYGASETPQLMSVYEVSKDHLYTTVPIGSGRTGVEILIIPEHGQRAGVGEIGEIVVRSPYLALGYLNNHSTIDSPFQINPYTMEPEDRLYRTGDMGRYYPNGTIEFIGRKQGMVKIRGHRVELSEIQFTLSQHADIADCVVYMSTTEHEQIAAYIVPANETINWIDLQMHCRKYLPDYMLPSLYATLDHIPLTFNGKVDIEHLPQPQRIIHSEHSTKNQPITAIQQVIARIWKDLLQLSQVQLEDHFFEIGGHSLLLVQAHQQLEEALEREIHIVDMFRYPTIITLATYLESSSSPALVTVASHSASTDEIDIERKNKRAHMLKMQKEKRKGKN